MYKSDRTLEGLWLLAYRTVQVRPASQYVCTDLKQHQCF